MLTLSLLRHAEASSADPKLGDHERPLTPRGRLEAARIGSWIVTAGLRPDDVLCSSALRARDTLALLLSQMHGAAPEVAYDEALYLASSARLLERIRQTAAAGHVLLIAHNPGLHSLALGLIRSGPRNDTIALASELPPASLAVIDFDVGHWSELGPAAGHLRVFMSPRLLP